MSPGLAELTAGATWARNEEGESRGSVNRVTLRDGGAFYLKYGVGRVADDIVAEAVRLRWLAGRLPAPAVRFFACEANAAWLLTEALPGLTGDQWLAREPGRLPLIVRALAGFMRRLHGLPIRECPFEAGHAIRLEAARRNVAEGVVEKDDFDEELLGWSAAEVLDEASRLAPESPGRVVTHGDFSLGNFVFDEAGEVVGCIDMGRLGVADPYQDITILWNNLREFGTGAAELLSWELGIADERRLRFHLCLDELF